MCKNVEPQLQTQGATHLHIPVPTSSSHLRPYLEPRGTPKSNFSTKLETNDSSKMKRVILNWRGELHMKVLHEIRN